MYLNQYSVRVIGGTETAGQYVNMRHGQTYRLQLHNSTNLRCDAQVEIDGKAVGTWRINAHDSIMLERPAHDEGKFTFYKAGTREASLAQLVNDDSLGLLKVIFTPEVEPRPLSYTITYTSGAPAQYGTPVYRGYQPTYTDNTACFASVSTGEPSSSKRYAGGTGLSGHSNQSFGSVSPLEYDYSKQTIIYLRLVCADDDGPRPLTQLSTPVPPPVK